MTPDLDLPPSAARDLSTLIDCGDRACAQSDLEGLRETAHLLAMCVAGPPSAALRDVEQLAAVDMLAARAAWGDVATRVRALLSVRSDLQLAHRSW